MQSLLLVLRSFTLSLSLHVCTIHASLLSILFTRCFMSLFCFFFTTRFAERRNLWPTIYPCSRISGEQKDFTFPLSLSLPLVSEATRKLSTCEGKRKGLRERERTGKTLHEETVVKDWLRIDYSHSFWWWRSGQDWTQVPVPDKGSHVSLFLSPPDITIKFSLPFCVSVSVSHVSCPSVCPYTLWMSEHCTHNPIPSNLFPFLLGPTQ